MAKTLKTNSLKEELNKAPPGSLPDMFRTLAIGSLLRAVPTTLRKKTTAVGPNNIATIFTIALPDDAKAAVLHTAYGRVNGGGVVAGPLTVDAEAATAPATLHAKVTPTGDLAFLGTDAWTSVDVLYTPEKCDIVEAVCSCVAGTGVVTIPTSLVSRGVVRLLEAEILVGTLTGTKFIVAAAAAAPATTLAGLNLAKTAAWVAIADAATSVRLKLAVVSAVDSDALLAADSNFV